MRKIFFQRTIFCSPDVKKAIDSLFTYITKKHFDPIKEQINFVILEDGMTYDLNGWNLLL